MSSSKHWFIQSGPELGNQFTEDTQLQAILSRLIPEKTLNEITPDLTRLGERVLGDILQFGREAEEQPPQLRHHDVWGNRIDQIQVSHGWKELNRISAEEGLVSIPFEKQQGPYSRLYQMSKLYLFGPSCAVYTCPLSMTDGAARLIEVFGDQQQKEKYLNRLTSRDPQTFWTSGQWMTERTGGSDVGGSETTAEWISGNEYALKGYKYFTSAITSNMAVTLARVVDADPVKRGLSCFIIETQREGGLNHMNVVRLKEKLGTKAVPTAELELHGSRAYLVGPASRGIPVISVVLNITRYHNGVASVAMMRRGIALARDYASKRNAFGESLSKKPLHLETLAALEVRFRGCLQLLSEVALLLGRSECNEANPTQLNLLRVLTPLLKLWAGKESVSVCSEVIEAFGGNGYMEDSFLPVLLRDAQVTAIWEGTTNVLSLDLWKALRGDAYQSYCDEIERKLSQAGDGVTREAEAIKETLGRQKKMYILLSGLPRQAMEGALRLWSFRCGINRLYRCKVTPLSVARVYIAGLLVEHAAWSKKKMDEAAVRRWLIGDLSSELDEMERVAKVQEETRHLALDDGTIRGVFRARY
ncbi:acyl-CoA dehydrogenase [Planoprotostelium fungivorum]|uniref:Acyl-CoA dehydrogenase n=1 Tax=Planoprotostelium fungivorum TaxID=1890364 RepID=A0A2P6MR95_9EUKA|nr:acyl-CoA dehydrogenase [Planoprotostelium fungivorum]